MGFTVFIILIPLVMFLLLSFGSKWLRPRAAGVIGTLGMTIPLCCRIIPLIVISWPMRMCGRFGDP